MLGQILLGLFIAVGVVVMALLAVRLIVGDPHMLRDMWQCRNRPIKRWRERRR